MLEQWASAARGIVFDFLTALVMYWLQFNPEFSQYDHLFKYHNRLVLEVINIVMGSATTTQFFPVKRLFDDIYSRCLGDMPRLAHDKFPETYGLMAEQMFNNLRSSVIGRLLYLTEWG